MDRASAAEIADSGPITGRVKPKTMKLLFTASQLVVRSVIKRENVKFPPCTGLQPLRAKINFATLDHVKMRIQKTTTYVRITCFSMPPDCFIAVHKAVNNSFTLVLIAVDGRKMLLIISETNEKRFELK